MASPSWLRTLSVLIFASVLCACEESGTTEDGSVQDGGSSLGPDGGTSGSDPDDGGSASGGGSGRGGGSGAGNSGTSGGSGSGSGAGGGASDGGAAPGAGAVVRTLAYHQVSMFTASPQGRPLISASGNSIVYTIAPGSGDEATPNEIHVMTPAGTSTEVDSYRTGCFCESQTAISADDSTVVSTDATQVRVVGSDATMMGALVFDSNEVWNIGVTEDGGTVYMLQRRNNKITGGADVERGIWAMDADGGNHRQLVGPSAIATLLGATADQVFPFAGCGKSMEFSSDGTRGVFAVEVGGMGQLAMTVEGTAVEVVKGPSQFIKQVAISGDGSKVAVWTAEGSAEEVSVMSFDGGNARVITTQPQGSCFSPITLNGDGSQLLSGDTALLFPTAGGDPVSLYQLTGGDGVAVGAPWHGVSALFSMTSDAGRFAYWNHDEASILQIGMLELDPTDLGAAPSVSSPVISEASLPRDRSIGANVSCEISDPTLVRAGTAVMLHGLEDTAGSWVSGQQALHDDGMDPDEAAEDGVFTGGAITAGDGAELGARIVRIKAEAKASDGRRHATAIDVSGLEVE